MATWSAMPWQARRGDAPHPDSGRAARRALVGVEARRLLAHPAVLASVPLTGLTVVGSSADSDAELLTYKFAIGGTLLIFTLGVMVAASLAASRSHRSGTDELFLTMPVHSVTRVAALLTALGSAVVIAMIVQAAVAAYLSQWNGVEASAWPPGASGPSSSITRDVATMLQGPVLVAFGGVLGVTLGRWVPWVIPACLIAGVAGYLLLTSVLWWDWGWQRLLLPLAHDLRSNGPVVVGDGRAEATAPRSAPGALAWHVAYLAGWGILLTGLALLGDVRRRRAIALAAGGLSVAAVAGVLQVVAWSR